MRTRQRLLRALVTDIIADVDETTREVILTVHWRGGQHSQLRVRKPKVRRAWLPYIGRSAGRDAEHGYAVVGRGHRRVAEPHGNAYRPGKDLDRAPRQLAQEGAWDPRLPFRGEERRVADHDRSREAAGVTNHAIRRLIKDGILPADQVVPAHRIRSEQPTCK